MRRFWLAAALSTLLVGCTCGDGNGSQATPPSAAPAGSAAPTGSAAVPGSANPAASAWSWPAPSTSDELVPKAAIVYRRARWLDHHLPTIAAQCREMVLSAKLAELGPAVSSRAELRTFGNPEAAKMLRQHRAEDDPFETRAWLEDVQILSNHTRMGLPADGRAGFVVRHAAAKPHVGRAGIWSLDVDGSEAPSWSFSSEADLEEIRAAIDAVLIYFEPDAASRVAITDDALIECQPGRIALVSPLSAAEQRRVAEFLEHFAGVWGAGSKPGSRIHLRGPARREGSAKAARVVAVTVLQMLRARETERRVWAMDAIVRGTISKDDRSKLDTSKAPEVDLRIDEVVANVSGSRLAEGDVVRVTLQATGASGTAGHFGVVGVHPEKGRPVAHRGRLLTPEETDAAKHFARVVSERWVP